MKCAVVCGLFLICLSPSIAQDVHEFKSGLAVAQAHRYGREAIATDELTYQLATGAFVTPREGQIFLTTPEGEAMRWTAIQIDTTGRFRGNGIRNGYIYLTYESPRTSHALLNVIGNVMSYVNGEPRGGDIYSDGWMYLPVKLKKGLNEILIRCGNFSRFQGVQARLILRGKEVSMRTEDITLPHVIVGSTDENLLGGVVVVNGSDKPLRGLTMHAEFNGRGVDTQVPEIAAGTVRKVGFQFNPANVPTKGEYSCQLQLRHHAKVLDEQSITIRAVEADVHRSYTFASEIDGSVQYYGVAPHRNASNGEKPALFLSVHGAGVEAIGQARAYEPKDWGVLVAPTNRRPRGFNWEDWGRLDAMEVFALAKKRFEPDPERIYLTGHSMGGHGTWFLGATYPDQWAAIAPCAGYPTLSAYGSADGRIPDSASSPVEEVLLRASNTSNVISLATNYKHHGVYVFHGDADRTVPVTFARQMREVLAKFHPDFSYYEYPGGSHWFGNESVDWPPLFTYFRQHKLKPDSAVNSIHFITANPAVSSTSRWVSIVQQTSPLQFSEVNLSRDVKGGTVTGATANVALLKIDLRAFAGRTAVSVTLDSVKLDVPVSAETFLRRDTNGWVIGRDATADQKNTVRSGTFKEGFNHRMVFVYGTVGSADEDRWNFNKARYDAEVWYYRGNGAVDFVADTDFDPAKFPDRGVILYGNASNNSAWTKLLANCPIQVTRQGITIGGQTFEGRDLGAYFTWPRSDSRVASVSVVAGTGPAGWRATESNQYFAGGSGFPDYMVFSADMLREGAESVKAAGFFDNDWKIVAPAAGHPSGSIENKIEGN